MRGDGGSGEGAGFLTLEVDPDGLEIAAAGWERVAQALMDLADRSGTTPGTISQEEWSGAARDAVCTEMAGLGREFSRFTPLVSRAADEWRSLAEEAREALEITVPRLRRQWEAAADAYESSIGQAQRSEQAGETGTGTSGRGAAASLVAAVAALTDRQVLAAGIERQETEQRIRRQFEQLQEELRERFARAGRTMAECTVVPVPDRTVSQFRSLGLSGAVPGGCFPDGTVFPPDLNAQEVLARSLPSSRGVFRWRRRWRRFPGPWTWPARSQKQGRSRDRRSWRP